MVQPYLASQEYDEDLNFQNTRFAISEPEPNLVEVQFNVDPGELSQPEYYDRKIRYQMVLENNQWKVDDISLYTNPEGSDSSEKTE